MTTTSTGGFLSTSFNLGGGGVKGRQNDQESERGKKSENTSPPQNGERKAKTHALHRISDPSTSMDVYICVCVCVYICGSRCNFIAFSTEVFIIITTVVCFSSCVVLAATSQLLVWRVLYDLQFKHFWATTWNCTSEDFPQSLQRIQTILLR